MNTEFIKKLLTTRFFTKKDGENASGAVPTSGEFLPAQNSGVSPVVTISIVVVSLILIIAAGVVAFRFGNFNKAGKNDQAQQNISPREIAQQETVLGNEKKLNYTFAVNVPSQFTDSVTFLKDITATGESKLLGGITTGGANIDAGTGTITASNILYSLKAGTGISISSGQTPTITNTDLGSAQKIFKNFKIGSDTITAGNNNDTLTFVAGSGITLSTDTSNKKLTITSAAGTAVWNDTGSVVSLVDSSGQVQFYSNTTFIDSSGNGVFAGNLTGSTINATTGLDTGGTLRISSGGILQNISVLSTNLILI